MDRLEVRTLRDITAERKNSLIIQAVYVKFFAELYTQTV